ncbi:MAG: hypothetical protein JWM98_2579 [Thermoleophilia bacterium]|nr:hypothetical protein [Thermoleophilia bacterium]
MATDERPTYSLTITGGALHPVSFRTRVGFRIEPPEDVRDPVRGIALREVPFGSGGHLFVADGTDLLMDLGTTALEPDVEVEVPGEGFEDAAWVDVSVAWGARVRAGAREDTDVDVRVISIVVGDALPERWVRVQPSGLLVGTVGDGELAALVFSAPIVHPTVRRVTLHAPDGWRADAHGTASVTIGHERAPTAESDWLDAPDPVASMHAFEHHASHDGTCSIVLRDDGRLQQLDAPVDNAAPVQIPLPDRRVEQLEVDLVWPPATTDVTLDVVGDRGRVRIDLGADVVEWVAVGSAGLVAGIDAGGALTSLVTPNANVHPEWVDGLPPGVPGAADQAAMLREHLVQMRAQFATDLAALERFATERPFAAFGLADPPDGIECMARLQDGPWDAGAPAGVTLQYGDEMARMLPDGDPSASLFAVVHERVLDHLYPAEFLEHDEHVGWLVGLAPQQDDSVDGPLFAGPGLHLQRMAEGAASAEPAELVVDDEPVPGTIVRTEHGFVARADRDGWRIIVRGTTPVVPALRTIDDLSPFISGQAAWQERFLAMQGGGADQAAERAASTPPAAAEARAASEALLRVLQPQRFGWDVVRNEAATAFHPDIVAAWGGADAFTAHLERATHLAEWQGHVPAVAADGSAAHVVAHVTLPRPGTTSGSSFSVGVEGDWWDHDEAAIRAAAAQQWPRERMSDLELEFNALVERLGDGRYVIATDLVRLLDAATSTPEQ